MTEVAATEAPATISSLMEGMKSGKPATVDTAAPAPPNTADWFFAEGIPGQGARPDFLDTKYKSMAEQAKAYKSLEKTLGATGGAPDQYDFGEYGDILDTSNPNIQEFMAYAKDNRITQDAFSKTLNTFVKYSQSQQPDMSKEIEKLGPDANKRIETVRRWAENNLSESAIDTIGRIAKGADVIELLDELRQFQYHEAQQPPGTTSQAGDFVKLTVAEIEAEMQSNRHQYMNDPRYRAEIQKKFEQAVG